jgi:phosphatidylserine/phosphatidylglycerophosphate/cardiolipin synthase-like enzyme
VALMARATRTLDVADYDFDLANVAQAMAGAAKRGVRVRMVTDSDTLDNTKDAAVQAAFKTLRDATIPIVPDNRPPIMHNKFTVVDGEWVEMGSWNYTDGDTYHLNNNMAIFHSRELADNYTAEFEKMFVQKKFGPAKPPGVPHPTLQIGGMAVENYFAAEDKVAAHVIDKINQAQHTIHFLAFSFTHDGMGQAMLARHKAGVEVQGVFETTGSNTPFSEYGKLKQAGLDVYQDGNPYVMHHKVILLDDRITIFGSFNFSDNADKDNDENLLIVTDPTFTAQFEQEYQRVLAVAKHPPTKKQASNERTEGQRTP